MASRDKIVFFDGVCNLCNGLVKFIIKKDRKRRIRFSPLQSETGQLVLKKIRKDPADVNTVVYISDGNYYFRSSAILNILNDLGGAWKLLYGFIIIPRFIRDSLYDFIAKHRYRVFGRKETCMVPSPDVRDRFLV